MAGKWGRSKPGHVDVGDDHVHAGVGPHHVERLHAVGGKVQDVVAASHLAAELLTHQGLKVRLVVDDEDVKRPVRPGRRLKIGRRHSGFRRIGRASLANNVGGEEVRTRSPVRRSGVSDGLVIVTILHADKARKLKREGV